MSDAAIARSRAERYLAQRVLQPRDEPRYLPPGIDATVHVRQRQAAVTGALEVYEELGILSNEDVQKWRGVAEHDRRVVGPATSSPAAIGVLERHFAEMDAAGDEAAEASRRFWMAHLAAACAGLLSEADSRTWSERQQDRLAVTDEDRRRLQLMRSTSFRELRRVIPGPARRGPGTTVVSVEIYADGVIANWRRVVDLGPDRPFADLPDASLADDAGTPYVHFSGGGSGTGEQSGYAGFGPAPPSGATELKLRLGGDTFQVALAGRGAIH